MDAVNHLELTVSVNQVRQTLRALLLAIFFHRNLDTVEPETYEIIDVHIAAGANASLDKEINAKVEEFVREFVDAGADRGELAVVFLQRKPRKGWFAVTEELLPWEEHLITLHFQRYRGIQTPPGNQLPLALLQLLSFCADKKGNVPPLQTSSEGGNNLSHQILIAPPPPSELFAPSPQMNPTRLTSPPPPASTTTTAATIMARDLTLPPSSAATEVREARRSSSPAGITPGAMGYFEQAKDGLRAVGARAGAVTGWTQRGGFGRP